MKKILLRIYRILFPFPYIKYCSQTIYEVLLGCLRMYEATNDTKWKKRCDKVANLLIGIQQSDGGFDIGYDFNFGMLHKKGNSTSPEMVGLLALTEYARVFDKYDEIKPYVTKAAEWIRRFARKEGENTYAIPYSPYNTREIMVYNGTSFACGALGYYLGVYKVEDQELNEIYRGMINYLEKSMYQTKNTLGKFWFYPVQSRTDISAQLLSKIDYYHQMQQVEMHSFAQIVSPDVLQKKIIKDASEHVVSLSDKFEITPYTNSDIFFKGYIHTWGLCSVISGLIMAQHSLKQPINGADDLINKVVNWILKNAWNGNYFYPILTSKGLPQEKKYMIRSDAWVFNSFCCYYQKNIKCGLENIIEKCYLNMEKNDFSGVESHAQSGRKLLIIKRILNYIK